MGLTAKKGPSFRKTNLIFLFLYILFPMYLVNSVGGLSFKYLLLFYLANLLIIFCLIRKNSARKYLLEYQAQRLQGKLNILEDENLGDRRNNSSLETKIIRYNKLKSIIEELNRNLDLESVADTLVSRAFSEISHKKGVCILYLIDKQLNLQIFKTKKEDKALIIRAKEGDIFDLWVLRHANPLLVENTRNDFRFDLEKLKTQDQRPVLSLINSPLVSEHRFLGTLRLDQSQPHFFSQEDLRFLVTICDLAAVALENSELFQRQQNLAIHDSLTALYTKGYFLERLREECRRGLRHNTVFSLLMLDIDWFKGYNDKFGHTAGDIVLKRLSQVISESLKELNPIVSRFGGEEFCVILERLDKQSAYDFAENLRKTIGEEKLILRREETSITVSIGISSFPFDSSDESELIQKADRAMYVAKQQGRNRVVSA